MSAPTALSDLILAETGWGESLGVDEESPTYIAGEVEATIGQAVVGAVLGGVGGASAVPRGMAIGFTDDAVHTAFQGMRGGGGHAMRHLMDAGLIPNAGSLQSRARILERLASPILTSPTVSFNWRVGDTATRGFGGQIAGRHAVVFVAKEGRYQGRVLSVILATADQIAQWGL